MASVALINILQQLDLISNKAVFFTSEKDGPLYPYFPSETVKKLEIIKPDAFFVFNNQPFILFFDLSGNSNIEREQKIHKQVWSYDYSPLAFIIKDFELHIFNAFSFDKNKNSLQEIKLSDSERNRLFSFWNLQTGESWKWLHVEHYKNNIQKKRVNQKLFDNIKFVREILINSKSDNPLSEAGANTLILRLIFIRYLIDRDVKMDPGYIAGNSIKERRRSFGGLIEKPRKLNEFFGMLNRKFNGALFNITVQLSKGQAQSLACVFNGQDLNVQDTLFHGIEFYFDIFDFSIIPVEIISGIYESLISPETKDEHSAIYTPSFLVEYILGETVDKYLEKKKISECSIFDPACGSGIFLVQSYRRMVDMELKLNGEKISKIRLREIAQNNLFGIDVNDQALQVSCFSIYIAMLDYQDPKTILDNFQFPALVGENLFMANFFDTGHPFNNSIKQRELIFILGNPPWKSTKEKTHLKWLQDNNKITGRYEIAQSFLLRSKDFMHPATNTSLIVTSTIFFNVSETTREFKRQFLTEFCLDLFFDLSPVRRLIFEDKSNPAAIVSYRLSDGKRHLKNIVKHLSVKSNMFLKYFKALIIEKFDQKEILQRHFLENDWMFKLALYGGSLDFVFLKRMNKVPFTILNILNKDDFEYGDGIYRGTPKNDYNFLLGKPVVETEEVLPYYTHIPSSNKKLRKADVFLESGRRADLFNGQSILIKHRAKNEKDIVISYSDTPVVFRHATYGITTSTEPSKLKLIYGHLITSLFTYYQFLTSSSWGTGTRPEIKLEEHLAFPYHEADESIRIEIVDTVSKFIIEIKDWYQVFRLGNPPFPKEYFKRINDIINQVYEVSLVEHDMIDYVMNISRYQFRESKQNQFLRATETECLQDYAQVFVNELGSVYSDEFMTVEIYHMVHFIAMNFIYSKKYSQDCNTITFITDTTDKKEILRRMAANLTISKLTNSKDPTKNLYIQKDIKGFERNSFYIIKPNEYKCWHRAIAWYDVAEIRESIEKAELNYLNEPHNVG